MFIIVCEVVNKVQRHISFCFFKQWSLWCFTLIFTRTTLRSNIRGGSTNPHQAWLGCQVRWGSFCWSSLFSSLGNFFGFFFAKSGTYGPQFNLRSPLWDQVRPHSIKKIGGRFYPTPATSPELGLRATLDGGFLGTSKYKCMIKETDQVAPKTYLSLLVVCVFKQWLPNVPLWMTPHKRQRPFLLKHWLQDKKNFM